MNQPAQDKSPKRRDVVRMGDIARMAGVSEATVSRALSGSPLVAEKTRQRILEIVRTTEFQVNEQASGLARGQSRTVEVVFSVDIGTQQRISEPFFADMLTMLTDRLADAGYDMLVSRQMPWDRASGSSSAFLSGRADGLIFVGQGRVPSLVREFASKNTRVVTWGAVDPYDDHCVVGTDNTKGAMIATQHLLSLGRQNFAFMGDRSLPEIAQRLEGCRLALAARGYSLEERHIIPAPFHFADARLLANQLPELAPKMDALVAASDMIALAAVAALRAAGRRVPEDVAVIGFDDIPLSAHVEPSLSTVKQDMPRATELLVSKMQALIAGQAAPSVKLPPELVVRASTIGQS